MRTALDASKLRAFIEEVGRRAEGPGRVYLVGGATALLLGIRDGTIDVAIKLDPEPKAISEAVRHDLIRYPGIDPAVFEERATVSSRRSTMPTRNLEIYPGGDLVKKGLDDLERSLWTEEALLVTVAAPRLRDLGLHVPVLPTPRRFPSTPSSKPSKAAWSVAPTRPTTRGSVGS